VVLRLVVLLSGLLVISGCATVSKEQAETERLMWEAASECRGRFVTIDRIDHIDVYGRLRFTYRGPGYENDAFLRCYQDEANAKLRAAAHVPAERIVLDEGAQREIVVPGEITRGMLVVLAQINGLTHSWLLVDTGASLTVLSTKLAAQLELPINANTRRSLVRVAGGREIPVPRVRLASMKLGTATIENLYVGVYDVFPTTSQVHGVLGMDFMRHFNVSIDHGRRRLVLTPRTE
jgi:predicted aspartyl protease